MHTISKIMLSLSIASLILFVLSILNLKHFLLLSSPFLIISVISTIIRMIRYEKILRIRKIIEELKNELKL
jgi:hypothetical protein